LKRVRGISQKPSKLRDIAAIGGFDGMQLKIEEMILQEVFV
jgi:hypothetical protein